MILIKQICKKNHFLLIIILSYILCDEKIFKINISEKEEILSFNTNSNFIYSNLSIENNDFNEYIKLKFLIKNPFDLINIYISFPNQTISKFNFNYRLLNQENNSICFLPLDYYIYNDIDLLNILFECSNNCNFNLSYQLTNETEIYDNKYFNIFPLDNKKLIINYWSELKSLENNDILINIFTTYINYVNNIEIFYDNISLNISNKTYLNGYGLLITKNNNINLKSSIPFIIKFDLIKYELFTISTRIIKLVNEIGLNKIELNKQYNILLNNNLKEECFELDISSDKLIYMNGYSIKGINIFQVKKDNITSQIKNKTIINSEYFIFNISHSNLICFQKINEEADLIFQFLIQEDLKKEYIIPLIRTIPYKFYLDNNSFIYNRFASFNKNINHLNYEDSNDIIYIKITSIKGIIEYKRQNCFLFPNCSYDLNNNFFNEIIYENNTYLDSYIINSETIFVEPFYSLNQITPIIICKNEENLNGCEYIITLYHRNDSKILFLSKDKSIKKFSGFFPFSSNYFSFFIENNNTHSIKIELDLLGGEADLFLYNSLNNSHEIGTYYEIGNKEYIILKNNFESGLNGEYNIKIIANDESVYYKFKIIENFYYNDKVYIVPNETNVGNIFINETQIFTFIRDINNKYFIFFNSLNCELNISYNRNNIIGKNFQYYIDNINNNQSEIDVLISIHNFDTQRKNNNENCIFYFGGNELNNYISIIEGISYNFTLNKNISKLLFKFEFFKIQNVEQNNLLLIIDKYGKGTIKLKIYSNNKIENYLFVTDFKTFKAFEIKIEDYSSCETKCTFYIEVEFEKEYKNDINFLIKINYNQENFPVYLPKDQMILNILPLNGIQYFYTDIKKDVYAEIVINFKAYELNYLNGIIINKTESTSSKNWSKKVNLPIPEDSNLTFDKYNNKLIVNKNDTENCSDDFGCELYMVISNTQENISFLEYSIFLRYNESNILIKNNEYIFGSLYKTKNEKEYNYYIYKIEVDIKKFFIIFKTELCEIYIKKGKNEKPTKISYDYYINSNETVYIIESNTSLLNEYFSFSVTTKDLEGNFNSYYRFKIINSIENNLINYVDNEQEDYCHIKNNLNCYFIIPSISNNFNKNYFVYISYINNYDSKISIYVSLKSQSLFETMKNYSSFFNNNSNFNYSSNNNGFISINISESNKEDNYIIFKISSNEEGIIQFIPKFTYYNYKYLKPQTKLLYYTTNIDDIVFNYKNERTFSVYTQLINGKNFKINITSLDKIYLLSENEQNNILFNDISKNYFNKSLYIINSDNSLYIMEYKKRTSEQNFDELNYGVINYVNYFLYDEVSLFPIGFYLPIMNESKNIKFLINITNDISSLKNITFKGYITDRTSIMKEKRNIKSNLNILAEQDTNQYNTLNYTNIIGFYKESISKNKINEQKYFYIKISCENKNITLKNISIEVKVNLTSNESEDEESKLNEDSNSKDNFEYENNLSSAKFIASNKYLQFEIKSNEPNIIGIKNNNFNEIYKIEISSFSSQYNLMLRKFDSIKNISILINQNINIIKSYGKTTYILNKLSDCDKFYIIFIYKNISKIRNLDDSNSSEYIFIKYTSYKNNEDVEIYSFKPSKNNIYALDGYLIWSIGKIILNNSIYSNNTNYTLFLYDSNIFKNISEVENIKNLSSINNYTNYLFDEENNLVYFNISQSNLPEPGIYFVVVKAEILTKNNDIEILCSKAISLKLSFTLNEELIFSYSSYDEHSSNTKSSMSSFSNINHKSFDSNNNDDEFNDKKNDYSNSEEHNFNKKNLIIVLVTISIIFFIVITIFIIYIYIKRKQIKNNIKNKKIILKIEKNNQNENEINESYNTEENSSNSKVKKNKFFSIKENEK